MPFKRLAAFPYSVIPLSQKPFFFRHGVIAHIRVLDILRIILQREGPVLIKSFGHVALAVFVIEGVDKKIENVPHGLAAVLALYDGLPIYSIGRAFFKKDDLERRTLVDFGDSGRRRCWGTTL